MAQIKCRNGNPHVHSSVPESRECWAKKYRPNSLPVRDVRTGSLEYATPSKIQLMLPLIQSIPDGYFAVQLDEDSTMWFLRFGTVKNKASRMNGWRVIQSLHGPDSTPRYSIPTGSDRVIEYGGRGQYEDAVLLVVADFKGATLRYAREIGKCGRCNARLTSDYRKLGVGPECIKHWGWVREEIALRGGL